MRKLFSLMLVLGFVAACGDSDSDSPTAPTPTTPTCSYSLSSTSLNIAGTGGTASIAVTAGSGCAWTVTNNASFVTVTSATSQTGNGTVNLTFAENTGDTRTGTLTIAGQTVNVTQAAGDALYGNWAGTIVKGAGCPATLPASVAWNGTVRRTGAASSEIVISIPSVGISNQAIPLIVNGNALQLFVPIDTLYTFNATLAADRRSFTGTFSGGSCNGTWSGNRT